MPNDAYLFVIFKGVVVLGFAVWTAVAALNNIVGFRSAVAAIAATMAMAPLKEAPPINSPLSSRALAASQWSVSALVVITAVQIFAAVALGIGGALLISGQSQGETFSLATSWALIGFTLLTGLWFAMMIGGLWFGYWIRQESLQLTHIALLALTIFGALVIYI